MHPYSGLPDRNKWSRSVSKNFDASAIFSGSTPLIREGEKVVTAGSCFAANIIPYLVQAGLTYHKTERLHGVYRTVSDESLSYGKFSAAYGNIYTARQLLQLLRRCVGTFQPKEYCWIDNGTYIDPYRPGLRYKARSQREFDLLTKQHLAASLRAFVECEVLVFTLGLTESWISAEDGAVFPACPGTIAGAFNPGKHVFKNFTVSEITADLSAFFGELKAVNPHCRIILTVSPVPLVATAEERHVLSATIYSKSVLRVAAEEMVSANENVHYFPAYEIITGPQAPYNFYEDDRRNVSVAGVDAVMTAFLANCGAGSGAATLVARAEPSVSLQLSSLITQIECEEGAQDME